MLSTKKMLSEDLTLFYLFVFSLFYQLLFIEDKSIAELILNLFRK